MSDRAALLVRTGDGREKTYPLLKRLISVGRSPDNDVILDEEGVPDTALHLQREGEAIEVVSLDGPFLHNGKKKTRARLGPEDELRVGSATLRLGKPSAPRKAEDRGPLVALERLHEFSKKVLGNHPTEEVLAHLMDTAIELTGADKGFLVLLEGDAFRVEVARNGDGTSIVDAEGRISDTIVQKVVENRQPLIISDALRDEIWRNSASVVNLKLCSVMCAPLMEKGDLFGLLYLGNDRVANLFEERDLEVLNILASQASLLLQNARILAALRIDNEELRKQLDGNRFGGLLGSCPAMMDIYRKIEKVARTDVSVLLQGETGTGKEMLAREIHRRSHRADGPFVAINCGAIPESLLESELFGHARGAFTGASHTRIGKFQAAHGGTLFLDEIGEMPPLLQVKILRAIQERMVTKVGETRPEPVDIRIIAATNKDLKKEIAEGRFREDLFYRLNVVALEIPPLRERGNDVLVLARYFLDTFAKEFGVPVKGFDPRAEQALRRHDWPGNVRELENRIKRAVVLADQALITPKDLELEFDVLDPTADELEVVLPLAKAKEEFQRRYINEVLKRNGGNRTKTARDLGVDPRTIFRHLEAERAAGRLPPE
ncbi:MAG TPA: sigma 54-interacting transcriptional regulator [Fredinandcohnia sp.]|nr:sigma 54-interacting transcriptional regulator [Fredinandcohnia sp.]